MAKKNDRGLFNWLMLLTVLIACVLIGLSIYVGKTELFLLLNVDLGRFVDVFFRYVTHGGDGLLWVGWFAWALKAKNKERFPLIASSFVVSTVLVQVFKQVILPVEARPRYAIANQSLIHFVPGVTVHTFNSFPSGHTATAFCFALLLGLVARNKWWGVIAFVVACLAGYSRIYLGQHFPLDVGAGMIAAFLSLLVSTHFKTWYGKRQQRHSVCKYQHGEVAA